MLLLDHCNLSSYLHTLQSSAISKDFPFLTSPSGLLAKRTTIYSAAVFALFTVPLATKYFRIFSIVTKFSELVDKQAQMIDLTFF